ncbi:hypothetical protein CLG96_13920 [Sphingomonas oleivorans]|uniref:Phytoene synthase n=2 Tax=Sphingomonas oleivorans TaxID=1735121 RepID=A0A2T5FWR6_9SPHN|nr:squalene/phytoene synthase family protein [Sphingomonas oleivorans]PTQ10208.1 hypothetical protein CLG96_13920 [Sphingomonas oleivorans]
MLAYVPAEKRPALTTLWRLDERLGGVVGSTRETMIGHIRLAWWREALEALDMKGAPAEPLLRDVAAHILPKGISGAELAELEAGWAMLLETDPPDPEAIAAHGRARGRPLFSLAARLLVGSEDEMAAIAGEGWALADLSYRLLDPAGRTMARRLAAERLRGVAGRRWPAPLRPLGMLAALARRDAASEAAVRRQGAPGRVARMLAHRFTGR